ncbi:hypothetical protein HI914_06873 [Erysiphe necator]|uniref:Uncharacterized protein n=1 Tax=Uncinula necator TaxID=52586 RepID=A0A0B1P2Z5_UNCNE|nr:hypothetical protein HI914_06873 [Erysiphe necator]KHJ32653.1 hypothetical protein EV44_g4470 [Erysiphe necator]
MNPIKSVDSNRVALHLADKTLSPIFSSAELDTTVQPGVTNFDLAQASSLSSLTNVAVTAYDALSRFRAGIPLSIIVKTKSSGPILISSYLNPHDAYEHEDHQRSQLNKISKNENKNPQFPPKSVNAETQHRVKDASVAYGDPTKRPNNKIVADKIHNSSPLPPLLIASAVARSSTDSADANKGIRKLIKAGRECQKAWIKEKIEASSSNNSNRVIIVKSSGNQYI